MSSFYLIVKRGETSLRLGYSAQQVHIIIIIIILTLRQQTRRDLILDYNQSYDFASYSTSKMLIGNTVFAYLLCAAMAEEKHME